jgi:hypothetical protein
MSNAPQEEASMSATSPANEPAPRPAPRIGRTVAAIVAAAVIAFGASSIVRSNASSGTPASTTPAQAGQAAPSGWRGAPPAGMGTPVTGATLAKLKAVATAKYPGTVERAFKRSDGSYEVHVIKQDGSGEVHVLLSKAFKITGTETGGPGRPPGANGQAPPSGQAPPAGGTQS